MAKTDFKSVDDYIASQPEAVRGVLEQVRSIIRKAVPGTEELIAYQIPVYKLDGRAVIFFAGWKQHYSLYPVGERLVATFQDELSPYEVSKGTIRFPLSQRVPVKLIERIAKLRATEVAEGAKPKTKTKPKPKPKTKQRAKAAISAPRASSTSRRAKPRRSAR
jgi:uncharacterized protein YdhG (YjbR/CyaY superfamily)